MKPLSTSFILGMSCLAFSGFAQSADAQNRPNGKPTEPEGWTLALGAGALVSPNYLGDNAYSISVVPYIRITHEDRFFASVQEGIGYNLLDKDGFRAGPLASIEFGRDEDQGGPFQVIGNKTQDLIGLGDVDTSISLGGFVEYELDKITLSAKIGKAVTGHDGMTGEIGASYKGVLSGYGPPIIYNFGPRVNFGDDDYTNAFFGVTPTQAAASGLPINIASGGISSYGLAGTAIMPLTDNVAMTLFANFSHLTGDVADSPLVQQRGSENQGFIGLATAYTFK